MKTNIPIMVNGKVKASMPISIDASKTDIMMEAMGMKSIQTATNGTEVVTTVFVPNKMFNIVVK